MCIRDSHRIIVSLSAPYFDIWGPLMKLWIHSLVGLLGCLAVSVKAADRPNILFIYTDDQSTRTVSCYEEAHSWVNTPNIDALAAAGVRFEHAYIGSWCMTSRASLLTGLQQHGI